MTEFQAEDGTWVRVEKPKDGKQGVYLHDDIDTYRFFCFVSAKLKTPKAIWAEVLKHRAGSQTE
jgi:hypothetical protein